MKNSKLNEMFPKSSVIFLRIKNLFGNDNELIYQVSSSIFGNYIVIDIKDIPADTIYENMKFIVCSDDYSVYKVFI